jgi:hypothetical protein
MSASNVSQISKDRLKVIEAVDREIKHYRTELNKAEAESPKPRDDEGLRNKLVYFEEVHRTLYDLPDENSCNELAFIAIKAK